MIFLYKKRGGPQGALLGPFRFRCLSMIDGDIIPSTKAGGDLFKTAPETLAIDREVPMRIPIGDLMRRKSGKLNLASALFLTILVSLSYSASAQDPKNDSKNDAKTFLQSAAKAMGDVNSIEYSGTGQLGYLGQAYSPGSPWPLNKITAYARVVDYPSRSSREELTVVEPSPIRKGGAGPFAGEQKQVNLVSGQNAWNQPGNAPQPAIAAAEERQLQIWLTPHGFVKAAMENNATAKKGTGGTVVSFTLGKFQVERHDR